MNPTRIALTSALALAAGMAAAQDAAERGHAFNRVASFPVTANMAEGEDRSRESSAEIIDASDDGTVLIYTDSPLGVVGFIDIADPADPRPLGAVEMEGEPTAASVLGRTAFVAVNTSESFTEPSGHLVALDLDSQEELARCDLGGQPDSTALAPDGSFLAVAIENERDEEAGDGRVGQMPAGWVSIVPVTDGLPDCEGIVRADVTGLAEIAPEDPEPEFVHINARGEIAVTLQENNHIVVLSREGEVLSHFSAGTVDLEGIDTRRDGAILATGDQPGRLREPDGIQWIDDDHFATANEGDMDGGSRSVTIWNKDGTVVWESGADLERAIVEIGHYPDHRSHSKGNEPEGLAFGVFDGVPLLFVLSERSSVVAVYDVTDPAAPVLTQLLPSGISPEGAVAIPSRGLLATANEADLGEDGSARSHVMIYEWQEGAPVYPHLTSAGTEAPEGGPLGWGALSGLVADPERPGTLYAVSDSVLGMQPTIFTIDATQVPARITGALRVTRGGFPAQKLDLEGIALDGEGGFWVVTEGRSDRLVPHGLIRVGADGAIREEIGFPPALLDHETRFGAEGVTVIDGVVWIAIQRPWRDDPENHVKLVSYNPASAEWRAVRYETAAPTDGGWVGLGDMTVHGDHVYLIERDNHLGEMARTKLVTRVPLAEMVPAPLGGELPVVTREVVRDLLEDLTATGGYVVDKVEGLAIDGEGTMWLVTDNDGVQDSSGETLFWSVPLEP
ncbi:esterase-like activity of phytase family protein [Rubellimicrobium sp. CFH 75288]|uniref:esterase-like activity of phytase family protein n=1 Tax=Rubellimicrobium sp. CFH 75288 TaxID=2697034 RepID=UPI00141339F0|nr:esterase-like activity of phytase family protein [Rubellimicrobium sp. CFH 75288]NAZ36296.1 alkaline phosphatase [Rubellimicrobium sp. CFH 75288]